jgi:hypothetical protein
MHTLSFLGGECVCLLTLKVRTLPNVTMTYSEVFQLEHPPLASNRGTHLHIEKSRREWGRQKGERVNKIKHVLFRYENEPKLGVNNIHHSNLMGGSPSHLAFINFTLFICVRVLNMNG